MLFRSFISREMFVGFAPVSATIVCATVAALGQIDWRVAAVWILLVALVDQGLTRIDKVFRAKNPPDDRLAAWGWGKTTLSTLHGLAWGLSPILLHKPGSPATVLAPLWGIVNLSAASTFSTASFPPCMLATMTAAIVPASIFLLYTGGSIETISAVCLLMSWPFVLLIGVFAARNSDKFIISRLDTADLLEQQKVQTRLIQQAHAERTRFFSAASHDLRQPLHALGFYVSLMGSASADKDRREILPRLSECATSLDRQFNAIMGVAETDSAIEHAAIKPTRLQDVFERARVSVEPEAALKRLRLRLVPTRLGVMVAPDLLERVLVNLAINAVRYTTTGRVLIGARRKGETVQIWVADTGVGIAEQDRERIFEDFVQVDNPERNREKGFGLGLAIVRRLCQGLGWKLDLHSEVGKGSAFVVTVPLATIAQLTAPATDAPLPALTQLQRLNVLFVDDDSLVRDAMSRMLADWGMQTRICRTGDEALAILAQREPQSRWHALLDHRPAEGETGLALADRIRTLHGDAVKVVLVTGETDDAVLDEARRRGIGVLRKPVKPIRLRAALSAPFDETRPPLEARAG